MRALCSLKQVKFNYIRHDTHKYAKYAWIMTESIKNDFKDDKLRWDLLPLQLVEKVVEVFHFGAKKYSPNSWQSLPDGYDRYKAALLRHITAYERGETKDPESGLHHLAHAAWNALAILHFALKNEEARAIKIITSMEKETIKNKVFEIIKSKLSHKDTPLTMESKLEDDLWMDSLDEVEILMELEKEFGILIPNDDPGRCLTVKDVVDYMIRRMEE